MEMCLTPRQREFRDLAGRLADTFADRAAVHDCENSFPFENYDDLRESGYLNLTVPEELGGAGATLLELIIAQERLAMGDGSTALAVNMHVSPIGQWASIWRETHDPGLEQTLRDVAAGKIVWASLTSEPGVANNMMDAKTTAEKVAGGYRVKGYKIFCTNSDAASHFSFSARYEDPETGPRVMLFRTAKDEPGLTFKRTWDTLGMRGTQSNDLEIDGLFVPEENLVHSLPVGHFDARILKTVFSWALATFGAVYLGVGAGAMEWARQAAITKGRRDDPFVWQSFAEMETLLESARSILFRHAHEVMSGELYEQLTVQQGLARCALAKSIPANNAVRILEHVVDVAGGAAYMRKLPLERMLRDAQAGPIMPYNNHQTRQLMGATALEVELAPTITQEESGHGSRPKPPLAEVAAV